MHARPASRFIVTGCALVALAGPLHGQSGTGLVRHAPSIDGRVDGSLQQMLAEPFTLNGAAAITGDAFVPGTPAIRISGTPAYAGTVDGTGAVTPSDYEVTLGGNASLGHIRRRTDPIPLPVTAAPAPPAGTRAVVLTPTASDPGSFSTLRDLTVNGNVGQIAVPPGAYGDFVANGGSGFTLGIAGAVGPAIYDFERLTLHAGAKVIVLGPVILRVANGFTLSGVMGAETMPGWLSLNIYSGGLTLNGGADVHGFVNAPSGGVTIEGAAQLVGGVAADRLVVRGGGLLRLTNRAPVASNATVELAEDGSVRVVLAATDADGDPLMFTVTTAPAHGTLSGAPPVLTYSPTANYAGTDGFSFKAGDGHVDSEIASIQLRVTPVNDRPSADPKSIVIAEDTAGSVTLSGSDIDGDALTFTIVAPPAHGVLGGAGAVRTYQPAANYHGTDAFTYMTNDAELSSEIATAAIVITPVNDPPVAVAASYAVNEGATVAITLTGTDVDGDALSFRPLTAPANGSLSGTAPNLTYRPNGNFGGVDSFTFVALDGQLTSAVATISIQVTDLNFAPVATPAAATTNEDTPATIALLATDVDRDALGFSIVSPPQHGTLGAIVPGQSGDTASVVYTPAANFNGTDAFSFQARDPGLAESNVAPVTLTIRPVNDPPVAVEQSVSVNAGLAKPLLLAATDVEGDPLTYAIVSGPANGTIGGAPPNITYTAAASYTGADRFTFKANDGRADSTPAAVVVEVLPPLNRPPKITSTAPASMELRAERGGAGMLRGTIRDFSKNHSNFEENFPGLSSTWVTHGLVAPFIGGDHKPLPFNLGQYTSSTDTVENFNQWYRDVPGVNFSRAIEIPIAETTPGSGVYAFRSDSFFPIDNEFWGDEGLSDGQTLHNFGFTDEYHTRFVYQPGQTIMVGGDDGVWVFVDDRLMIDLGGVHVSTESTVSLDSLALIPGRSYPIDIFHAEQHTGGSSFRLRTSMAFETTETYRYAVAAADPDGDPITYSLAQSPAGMTIDAQTGIVTWVVDRTKAGTYAVSVQARDPGGLLDTQNYTLGVYVNTPPTISWPARYAVGRVGEPVAIAATVADDGLPAPAAVTLQWTKVSGPGSVSFSSAATAATTAMFSTPGLYVLQLAAADGSMTTVSSCEVRIEIPSDVTTARGASSWWPGNDTAEDIIGGRHAEPLFGAGYAAGKVGRAFNVDGVDDILRVRANPALDLGAASAGFSIGFWMRSEIDNPMGDVLAWRTETYGMGMSIGLDNYLGSRRLWMHLLRADGTDTTVHAEGMWLLNDWVHIGFTYDRPNGIARLYRNGVLKLEQSVGEIRVHTVADLWWGSVSGFNGNYFRGQFDELMFFRRSISSAEIFGLYACGASGALPPSGNLPPVVNAGADLAVRSPGQSVPLGGSVSDDSRPAGGRVTAMWSLVSGPAAPVFADATQPNTTLMLPATGSYVLKLTANDGEASAADTVDVRVGQIATARPAGLSAWWPGNDSAEEVVSGLNGSWIGGPLYSAGAVSDAFNFDGVRQVRVPASVTLDSTGADGLTIEFWWKLVSTTGAGTVMQWRNSAGASGVSLGLWYFYGWRFTVDLKDTTGASHQFYVDGALVDTWQHMVVSYDRAPGVVRVYRNGAQVYQSLIGSFTPQTSYDLYWGNVGDDRYRGGIDEVSLYRRALTSEEAYALYAANAAGKVLPGSNLAPVVNAGPDRYARTTAESVTLAGTVNDDGLPGGNGLITAWTALSGPGVVTFGSTGAPNTTATFSQPGVYVLQLAADDGILRTVDAVEARVGPFGAADLRSDLVAWWTANNTPRDVVGDQRAFWVGGSAYVPGAVGSAFSFDGARYLRVPASPTLNASTWPGLSIELWVRPTGMPQIGYGAPLLQWRQTDGPAGVSLEMGYRWGWNLNIYLTDTSGQSHVLSGVLAEDVWQHLVLAYDRVTGRALLYRNGGLLAEASLGSFTPQISYDLLVGSPADARFRGALDEVAIYRRALSPMQVATIYAAGAVGKSRPVDGTAPLVNAGPDIMLPGISALASLNGSVTDDAQPLGPATVEWSVATAPAGTTVSFANPAQPTTTATFSAAGTYLLRLTANDGYAPPQSDVMEVRISPGSADSPSNIAAWWPGNGNPSDTVNHHDLQLFNGATYGGGRVLQGFAFDGVASFARVDGHSDFDIGASPQGLTIEFWARWDVDADRPLFTWTSADAQTEYGRAWLLSGGRSVGAWLRGTDGQDRSLSGPATLVSGKFTHIAITYDKASGKGRLYCDGLIADERSFGTFIPDTGPSRLLWLGRNRGDSRLFKGVIDEFTLYGRALSDAEIAAIVSAGPGGKSPLDDNAPPAVNAGADVAVASSADAVTLAGTVVDDNRPFGPPTAQWRMVAGPGNVTFADAGAARTTATFGTAGTYLLELTGSDGLLAPVADSTEVRVGVSLFEPPPEISAWWPANLHSREIIAGHAPVTLRNGATYASGRVLHGFSFDGVDDHGWIPAHPDIDVGASAAGLTIEFWAKPTENRDGMIMAWGDAGIPGMALYQYASGREMEVTFRDRSTGSDRFLRTTCLAFTGGQWTHIAITQDRPSGEMRIYVNGIIRAVSVLGSSAVRTQYALTLGRNGWDTGFPWKGVLDELALYQRPLTPAEIGALYVAGADGKAPPDDNRSPIVNAGSDIVLADTATSATLGGSVSDDNRPFGAPLVEWKVVEGPGNVVFGNAHAAATTAAFSAAGTYLLELSASDQYTARVTSRIEARVGAITSEISTGISAWWPANLHGREVVNSRAPLELLFGATYGTGRVLEGIVLDGVDDTVRVLPHADIDVGASSAGFTIEFWVKPTENRDGMIMSWGTANIPGLAIYEYAAGREVEVTCRDRSTGADHFLRTTGTALTAGQWTHVALTQDRAAGELRLYANGTLRASATGATYAVRTQYGLMMGRNAWDTGGFPWKGTLDELALYQRPLSATEVAALYTAAAAGKCPDLANRSPAVIAGGDRENTPLTAVSLAGSATDDGRALSLRYQWTKVSGPGGVQFASPTATGTTVSFDAIGRYELRLQAYDGLLAGSDTVAIWAGMPRAPDGIAVWWPADSHSHEVIRGNHDATLRNGATYGPGRVADAFQFDGIDDYATVEAHPDLNVGTSPAGWTIEWWAKNRGSGTMLYWSTGGVYFQAGAALSGNLRAANGTNYSFDANGWAANEKILLPLETWTHLAVSFDRPTGTLRYYANGALKRTEVPGSNSALSTSGLGTTGTFYVGGGSSVFKGLIDEIAFYTRSLTSAEVLDIYQATNGGKAPPLNLPPVIAITSPPDNASLAAEAPFKLTASASDSDGAISRVEFLRGSESLGFGVLVTAGVYELTAAGLPIGQYSLTARATDDDGAAATSAPVTISVVLPDAPFAEITAPDEDVRISAPTAIMGVAATPILVTWTLEHRLKAPDAAAPEPWTVFATGTTSVGTPPTGSAPLVPGTLGTFDPTRLINGIYELRLRVTDTVGRIQVAGPIAVVVEGNMKIGAFTLAFEDLKVPLAGIPITVTRTYDSRDPRVGDFGPGWRVALNNIRVQKNRHLGLGWWQTPQQGSGLQFYYVESVRERMVTVVMPDGQTHRFRAGALVKVREGDPDNASFAVVVTHGKYRFYPVGDTTSKLEPLDATSQLAEDFWIGGTGDQDLRAADPAVDPFASSFNATRFRLTTSDGSVFIVDETLGLLELRDLDGNTLVLNRDASDRVTGVTSTQNAPGGAIARSIAIVRDATGRVDYIRDSAGRDLDYLYDAQGRLESFVNRTMDVTQFRYENTAFPYYLTKIIDPRGVAALRGEYDPVTGRLLKQIDAEGKETVFNGGLDSTGRFEKVKDRLGNETTFYYDERGNVTLKIDPLGARTTFSYWPDSDRVKVETDHFGNVKSMAYDAQGNVTVQTIGASAGDDPATPVTGYTTRTSYNARSAPTQITDPDGRVQTFGYDPATNNLLTHAVGVGGASPATTTYTYKSDGTVATITDALGNLTSHGHHYGFSDPAYPGAVKQTTATVTDPAGPAGSDPSNASDTILRSTRTLFDAQENQLAEITTRTLPNGASEDIIMRYGYDAENRLTATIMPDGRVSETRYTAFGKQDKSVLWKSVADYQVRNDANARITSYGYDSRGNQTSVTQPDGTAELAGFDAENRRIWSQDRRGYRTFFVYDAVGRLRFTIHPDANDGAGSAAPASAADPRLADNARTETVYDLVGRVTDSYDELRRRTQTVYFPDGTPDASRRKQTIAVRGAGNLVTTYQYDRAGNVRFVTDPRGNTVETRYDDQGRPRFVVYPATDEQPVTQSETKYDALGRRVEVVDPEGKVTRYRYDGLGRLSEVRQYIDQSLAGSDSGFGLAPTTAGIAATRYGYDALGNQQTQTDALGHVTTYWTDKIGRRTQRILPRDSSESSYLSETLQYDDWGNLWKRTDFAGKTTTFGYDALNRLKSKTADPSHPSLGYSHAIARIEFDFDANGTRTAARTFTANNSPLYAESTPRDERGRLIYKDTAPALSGVEGAGRLDYSYLANGLLKDVVSSNSGGVNIGYRYDEVNRLEFVDDTSTGLPTRTTGYSYNANGSLETVTQPNAVVHAYGYDTLNRLRTLNVTRGSTAIHAYDYRLRASGHRRQVIENATKSTTYTYDDLYRLTGETITADPNGQNGGIGYDLDKVGNRLNRTSQITAVTAQLNQSYNARDWLGGDTYNANGSTLTATSLPQPFAPSSPDVYDFEERLIVRTRADGTSINITYDADGHRIRKNILNLVGAPVSSTSWLIDTNNLTGYAQVFEERVGIASAGTTPASLRTVVYAYGNDLISQAASTDGQPPTVSYYIRDGHGSTRELTDSIGTITDRYTYDAFGILIFRSGTTANAYLYTGEQFDLDLGLYYLRARYLNPESGRFWSHDGFEGGLSDPASLHKYSYANGNPVSGRDPSGYITLGEVAITGGVVGILAKIAVPALHNAGFNATADFADALGNVAIGLSMLIAAPRVGTTNPAVGTYMAARGVDYMASGLFALFTGQSKGTWGAGFVHELTGANIHWAELAADLPLLASAVAQLGNAVGPILKVRALDVSQRLKNLVNGSSQTYWSGRAGANRVAAEASGLTTLESTTAGEALEAQDLFSKLPYNEAIKPWEALSEKFAWAAKGRVIAWTGGASPTSVWRRIELPTLLRNPEVRQITILDATQPWKTVIIFK